VGTCRNGIHNVELVARAKDDRALIHWPRPQFHDLRCGIGLRHSSHDFEAAFVDKDAFIASEIIDWCRGTCDPGIRDSEAHRSSPAGQQRPL
jgi:hypothetical protein